MNCTEKFNQAPEDDQGQQDEALFQHHKRPLIHASLPI